jgi:hypothetical protein
MSNYSQQAKRMAFGRMPETCQTVERIMYWMQKEMADALVAGDLDKNMIEEIALQAEGELKRRVTFPFRDVLLQTCEELVSEREAVRS